MPEIFSTISSGAITVVSFLVVLGVLVFVHELGHFAVAKWAGIRVEEFGFGFPPRMLTLFKKGETEYTLNWLPLGGFVRMIGENGEDANDPRSFASKSKTWRAAVLVAGSTMNLILPIFLFAIIAMTGVPDGEPTGRVDIMSVEANSPAAEAGLEAGDEILYVANQRVTNVSQLISLIQQFENDEIVVDVERDGEMVDLAVVPRKMNNNPQVKIGIAIADQREIVYYGPIDSFVFGVEQTGDLLVRMITGISEIIGSAFNGTVQNGAVAGPVGIMQVTGEIAQTGNLQDLLYLAALLSINLAIMNMLPFPALDGGRLIFVLLEALRGGKRISPEREGLVHLVGMLVLLGLMGVISVFDLQRLL
ncbi:MAG: RIP metalloprotease RseP, partial [Ardenticatenaceae bacterium]